MFITDGPARRAGAQLGGLHSMSAYSAGAFPVTITGNLHKLSHPAPPSARRMPQAGPRGRCAGRPMRRPKRPTVATLRAPVVMPGQTGTNWHTLGRGVAPALRCPAAAAGRVDLFPKTRPARSRADALQNRGGTAAARRVPVFSAIASACCVVPHPGRAARGMREIQNVRLYA